MINKDLNKFKQTLNKIKNSVNVNNLKEISAKIPYKIMIKFLKIKNKLIIFKEILKIKNKILIEN
jgi:hypothetical protein